MYMIWFGWVLLHINHCRLFNAKSRFYIYINYIWLVKNFADYIFKQAWAHFFQQLNSFKHFSLIRIILLTINHLFAHS